MGGGGSLTVAREEWVLSPLAYWFLCAGCLASLSLRPLFSSSAKKFLPSTSLRNQHVDLVPPAPFLRFCTSFLRIYSLASVLYGFQLVLGENEFTHHGLSREQIGLFLSAGAAAALIICSFAGILSDLLGPGKACALYFIGHTAIAVLRALNWRQGLWISTAIFSIMSCIFSFCFETWMVAEHERQGQRQDILFDAFWLMAFFESASLVGAQGAGNVLTKAAKRGFFLPCASAVLLAMVGLIYFRKELSNYQSTSTTGGYRKSFFAHVFKDKRILALVGAQTSLYFSMMVFWFLSVPTIVADGRDVQLSQLYPCFIGSRMLGSTVFPWFQGTALHNDLTVAYVIAGAALAIVAYDYQEIGVLVILFCIFNTCVGFILPSLSKLRTLYLPNELRGGMISLSLVPANAFLLLVLLGGGFYHNLNNSTIIGFAACGLFMAGGCIHILQCWRKSVRHNRHAL